MSDLADGLFAIDLSDSDDYAETAAGDTASLPRTYQSEEAFRVQKATYSAKIDGGASYKDLMNSVPNLRQCSASQDELTKITLNKVQLRLLASAVAELYYNSNHTEAIDLCRRTQRNVPLDKRTAETIDKWIKRCESRT